MSRRGIAMIVVLAACVVIMTAAGLVARARATSMLSAGATESFALALEVAEGSETATLAWLRLESGEVVLDPASTLTGVRVLSDQLRVHDREVRVVITAWDQCAMLPNSDLVEMPSMKKLAAESMPGWIGSPHPGADVVGDRRESGSMDSMSTRFATHNPSPLGHRQRGGASATININTAPEPLLRAACTDLGIDAIEPILEARRSGEKAGVTTAGSSDPSRLRLVAASTVWSTRTEIVVSGPGGVSISVWSVYSLRGGTWVREQRFVIAD